MDTQSRHKIFNHLLGFRLPASYEIRTAVLSSDINPYIFRAGHQGAFFIDTFFNYVGISSLVAASPFATLSLIANEHRQALVESRDYGRFGQLIVGVFTSFIPEETSKEVHAEIKTFLTLQYFDLVNGILKFERSQNQIIH